MVGGRCRGVDRVGEAGRGPREGKGDDQGVDVDSREVRPYGAGLLSWFKASVLVGSTGKSGPVGVHSSRAHRDAVGYIVTRPRRVAVAELRMLPADQA